MFAALTFTLVSYDTCGQKGTEHVVLPTAKSVFQVLQTSGLPGFRILVQFL